MIARWQARRTSGTRLMGVLLLFILLTGPQDFFFLLLPFTLVGLGISMNPQQHQQTLLSYPIFSRTSSFSFFFWSRQEVFIQEFLIIIQKRTFFFLAVVKYALIFFYYTFAQISMFRQLQDIIHFIQRRNNREELRRGRWPCEIVGIEICPAARCTAGGYKLT